MSASTTLERVSDVVLSEQLFEGRALPIVAHLVLLALVFVLVADTLAISQFIPWAAAIVVSLGAHVAIGDARGRRDDPRSARRLIRLTMLGLGLAWGVGAGLAAPELPTAAMALLLLGLAGLAAGGLATLVADRWVYPIYATAMFGPVLVGVLVSGHERLNDIGVGLIVVFLVFSIRLHGRAHRSLVERVLVEATLRDRERQLASAQAIAHVGSWEFDLSTKRVTWSDEAYRLWGVPMGSPVGYDEFIAGVHPDDKARVAQLVHQGLAEGASIEFECRIVCPNGDTRHLFNRNVVVKDKAGRPLRLSGTCLDITDRKVAEENQRHLVTELRSALAEVKTLEGILPICASCKRIRTDGGQWQQVESYVRDHSAAEFTHGLCPDCAARDWGAAG